jgi:VanZ family protein
MKMDQHRNSQMALWGIVAIFYAAFLVLIAGPFRPELDVNLTGYKVGHVAAFTGLGLLIAYYFRREFELSIFLGITLTWVACTFFGGLVELYQCLLPGRSPELRDIALDSIGAFAGALAYGAHRMAAGGTLSTVTASSRSAVEGLLELLERR